MDSSQLINFLNAFIFRDIDVEEEDDDDLLDLVERNVEVLLLSLKLQDSKLVGIDGIDMLAGFAVGVAVVVLSNNEVLMTVLVDSMDVVNVVLLIK